MRKVAQVFSTVFFILTPLLWLRALWTVNGLEQGRYGWTGLLTLCVAGALLMVGTFP